MEPPVDLRSALHMVRDQWILVAAATTLATMVAGLVSWQQQPVYSARVTLFVSAFGGGSDTAASAYQGSLLAQQRAKSYTQLLRGETVMRQVAERQHLKLTPAQLSAMTSAEVVPETVLLAVTVLDASPARAQRIANGVADSFIALIPDFENTPAGKQPPVRVSVVNPAVRPTVPISPQPRRNLTIGLLAGLVIGIGLAAARHALDTTVKSTKQLVELTRVPSLGLVPMDPNAARYLGLPKIGRASRRERA